MGKTVGDLQVMVKVLMQLDTIGFFQIVVGATQVGHLEVREKSFNLKRI